MSQHYDVKAVGGEISQPLVHILLDDVDATCGGGNKILGIEFQAHTSHLSRAVQAVQKLSVATAKVENPAASGNPCLNLGQVVAHQIATCPIQCLKRLAY